MKRNWKFQNITNHTVAINNYYAKENMYSSTPIRNAWKLQFRDLIENGKLLLKYKMSTIRLLNNKK